ICSSRYSARAFLFSLGICQEASMMTRSGASSSAASSSVSVNQDFGCSVISNPNLYEDGRGRGLEAIEPSGKRQPLLTQECRVEYPTLVAGAVIGKDRDDRMTGAHVTCEPYRSGDIDTARSAEAQPFLAKQVEYDGQRLCVRNLIGLVDHGTFEIGGDAALADAFGDRASFRLELSMLVIIVERSAHRIGDADGDVLVLRLQSHGNAGERAARADSTDKAVDLALRVVPDLGRGRLDMAPAV